MDAEIINEPFCVDLVGRQGVVPDECWAQAGRRLMDETWSEVRRLNLPHLGLNHWVYLPKFRLFTGVELSMPTADIGSLERLRLELPRYLRFVYQGPYAWLPDAWSNLRVLLAERGEKLGLAGLEIYGHWHDDPQQAVTTILIALL